MALDKCSHCGFVILLAESYVPKPIVSAGKLWGQFHRFFKATICFVVTLEIKEAMA